MVLDKLSDILPSTLVLLSPWASSDLAANPVPDLSQTSCCPLAYFFNKLTLKELTYDSEVSYADNLPSAQLPLVPRPLRRGYRKLQFIFKLEYLPEEVNYFFSASGTAREAERKLTKLRLSVTYDPSEMSKAFGFNPYYIYDRRDVLFAIEHGPLRSVEKLAATFNPHISDFHFIMPRRNPALQVDGIDPMLFTFFNPQTNEHNYVRCIIVPLAPWEFTSEDFEKFSMLGVFTDGSDNAELMWSYVQDVCMLHECDYFVLTTYENWVFGRFSHTYAEGFVSEPMSRTSEDNVMRYLTYWILNSCFTSDTAVIQEIIRHELEYNLVKINGKTSDETDDDYPHDGYGVTLINRPRKTGRAISPEPFSDVDEETLPKPERRWNKWYKVNTDELREETAQADAQEEIVVYSELMKGLDISDSEETAVMRADDQDIESAQDSSHNDPGTTKFVGEVIKELDIIHSEQTQNGSTEDAEEIVSVVGLIKELAIIHLHQLAALQVDMTQDTEATQPSSHNNLPKIVSAVELIKELAIIHSQQLASMQEDVTQSAEPMQSCSPKDPKIVSMAKLIQELAIIHSQQLVVMQVDLAQDIDPTQNSSQKDLLQVVSAAELIKRLPIVFHTQQIAANAARNSSRKVLSRVVAVADLIKDLAIIHLQQMVGVQVDVVQDTQSTQDSLQKDLVKIDSVTEPTEELDLAHSQQAAVMHVDVIQNKEPTQDSPPDDDLIIEEFEIAHSQETDVMQVDVIQIPESTPDSLQKDMVETNAIAELNEELDETHSQQTAATIMHVVGTQLPMQNNPPKDPEKVHSMN